MKKHIQQSFTFSDLALLPAEWFCSWIDFLPDQPQFNPYNTKGGR